MPLGYFFSHHVELIFFKAFDYIVFHTCSIYTQQYWYNSRKFHKSLWETGNIYINISPIPNTRNFQFATLSEFIKHVYQGISFTMRCLFNHKKGLIKIQIVHSSECCLLHSPITRVNHVALNGKGNKRTQFKSSDRIQQDTPTGRSEFDCTCGLWYYKDSSSVLFIWIRPIGFIRIPNKHLDGIGLWKVKLCRSSKSISNQSTFTDNL